MSTKSRQKLQPFHWVGIDVSKPFFDAAVLSVPDQQTGVPGRELPVKRFPRTHDGVKKFVAWLEETLPEEAEVWETRDGVECDGKKSSEWAGGVAAARALSANTLPLFPDLHFEGLRQYVTPEIAVVEAVTTGTPVGGKPYEAHLVDVLTLRAGKIAAKRSYRKGQV